MDPTTRVPKATRGSQISAETAFFSLSELAKLVHSGTTSCTALTEFYIDRLGRYGPSLQAVAALTEEHALRQASEADAELAAVEHHFSVKIFGTHGLLRAEWHAELDRSEQPAYSLEIGRGDHLQRVEVAGTPGEFYELAVEVARMARSIREDISLPLQPTEARRAVALCLAAQRSLESGNIIALE